MSQQQVDDRVISGRGREPWQIRVAECRTFDLARLGTNYESAFLFTEQLPSTGFLYPVVVVPRNDQDHTMPSPRNPDEFVVKNFENGQYILANHKDILDFDPALKPFATFRTSISRFCQTKSMRLAMDWFRFRKMPLYFRWAKFAHNQAVYKTSSQGSTVFAAPSGPLFPNVVPILPKPLVRPPQAASRSVFEVCCSEQQSHSSITDSTISTNHDVNKEDELVKSVLFANIDKFELFHQVWCRGGFKQMTPERWNDVASLLGSSLPDGNLNDFAKLLSQYYQSQLLLVEEKYRNLDKSSILDQDSIASPAKRRKTSTNAPIREQGDLIIPTSNNFAKSVSPVRKQRSISLPVMSDFIAARRESKTVSFEDVDLQEQCPDSSATLGSKTRMMVIMKQAKQELDKPSQPSTACSSPNQLEAKNNSSPPMAPPELPLNAVAGWHRSVKQRRLSAPAVPLTIPVDHTKVNLDNVNFVLEQLNLLEERLARRSLHYWNEFGYGSEVGIDQTPCDPFDIRNLQRLRDWSQTTAGIVGAGGGNLNYNKPNGGRGYRDRTVSFSSSVKRGNFNRRRHDSDFYDYDSDSDSYSSEIEVVDQYSRTLEDPEIILRKEQELDLFLMTYGPTVFLDDNGRDITDSNEPIQTCKIERMVQVQERQIIALQQRFSDMCSSLRTIRMEIKQYRIDLREAGIEISKTSQMPPIAQESSLLDSGIQVQTQPTKCELVEQMPNSSSYPFNTSLAEFEKMSGMPTSNNSLACCERGDSDKSVSTTTVPSLVASKMFESNDLKSHSENMITNVETCASDSMMAEDARITEEMMKREQQLIFSPFSTSLGKSLPDISDTFSHMPSPQQQQENQSVDSQLN